jgi:chorismate mutase
MANGWLQRAKALRLHRVSQRPIANDRFMDIADWRKKIDEIDQKLVDILNQRAQAVQEIGRLKRDSRLPIYEPDRERIVLTQVQESNQGPLHHRHLVQIYERIMDVMRNIQKDEIVGDGATLPAGDTELDADVKD